MHIRIVILKHIDIVSKSVAGTLPTYELFACQSVK